MSRIIDDYTAYINHRFIAAFGVDSNTKYQCPYCRSGKLSCIKDGLLIEETPESQQERYDDCWEPEWVRYVFCGALVCKDCSKKTFCTGTGKLEFHPYCGPNEDAPKSINDCYEIELTPSYFEPPIPIFVLPSKCPEEIKNEVQHAFKLAFSDFSASGNRVRTCLELYIQHLNPSATGRLHDKIESIKNIEPTAYELIMAIKWLGNQGSHESTLQEYDLAFALEALEFCLNKTFNSNEGKLRELALLINSSKGSIAKT